MCTYTTVNEVISGSAKGPGGKWFGVSLATVYFDHPVHAMVEHSLNIDISSPADGPAARVALELSPESARALMAAIGEALASVPADLAADLA